MPKRIKFFIILACVTLLLLAFLVHYFPHSSLDVYISKALQEEVDEPRDFEFSSPLTWVSVLGNGLIAPISVLVIAGLFLFVREYKEAFFVLGVLVGDALVLLIKWIIHRPRPTEDLVKILHKFSQSSFPSGHVVHYVVLFGFLIVVMLTQRKFSLPLRCLIVLFLMLLILIIPISRIYLGAHWATDVIGGYLVGFIFLSILASFYLKKVT